MVSYPSKDRKEIETVLKSILKMSNPEDKEAVSRPNAAIMDSSGGGNAGGAGVSITITFNKAYVVSIPGVLKIVEFILLLLAFSIAADINVANWGRMSFFLFVTITSWLLVIAWFVLFTSNLHTKINLSINWNITLLIFAAVVAFLLLISSALLADDVRKFESVSFGDFSANSSPDLDQDQDQYLDWNRNRNRNLDSLRAAVAFGFIAMFVFIGDAVVEFLKVTGKTQVHIAL